jgi:hypothetical protein
MTLIDQLNDLIESTCSDHKHVWGEVETARMTGNPHRKCTVSGCKHISLDLDDEPDDESDDEDS